MFGTLKVTNILVLCGGQCEIYMDVKSVYRNKVCLSLDMFIFLSPKVNFQTMTLATYDKQILYNKK